MGAFLTSIEGRFKLLGSEPLLADWFTGVLRVPRGEMLAYVHMGFGSVYDDELHIHVERGRVTGSRVYDNRGEEADSKAALWDGGRAERHPSSIALRSFARHPTHSTGQNEMPKRADAPAFHRHCRAANCRSSQRYVFHLMRGGLGGSSSASNALNNLSPSRTPIRLACSMARS